MSNRQNGARSLVVGALVWCALGVAVGCGEDERFCTLRDCSNTLSIALEGYTPGVWYQVHVTSADDPERPDRCVMAWDASGAVELSDGPCGSEGAGVLVVFPAGNYGPPNVDVLVEEVVTDSDNVVRGTYDGAPWEEAFAANGPDCGPVCGTGALTFDVSASP